MQQFPTLIDDVAVLAAKAGLVNLTQQLSTQSIPLANSPEKDWQRYADILFTMLSKERDLGNEWVLSDDESDKLKSYLYANTLLVQCLKVAAVSDRQSMLHDLLLPPSYARKIEEDNK